MKRRMKKIFSNSGASKELFRIFGILFPTHHSPFSLRDQAGAAWSRWWNFRQVE
jgi:hypothetical protein